MNTSWFVIINPSAGNKKIIRSWNLIKYLLENKKIKFSYVFSEYSKHEITLVRKAIKKGYRKFISVGGDGTLHYIVNGVMTQNDVDTSLIKIAVIPLGTGNDWIKTYNIPNSIEKSILIIHKNTTTLQDIGCIQFNTGKKYYFNNLAGIGYDGYIINKLNLLKKLGAIAFLISGLYGLFFYKKKSYIIQTDYEKKEEKCLMILFGLCEYSGGGLKITKNPNPTDGLLDITVVKNFSFWNIIFNIKKLYTGKIVNHKKVETSKLKEISIQEVEENTSYIEADGEIIDQGSFKVSIIPKAIQFIIP